MSTFFCPHCGGLIQVVGTDLGVDVTGTPYGEQSMNPVVAPKLGRYYAIFTAWTPVRLSNGRIVMKGERLPAFNVNDGSDSDLYYAEAPPKASCEGFTSRF